MRALILIFVLLCGAAHAQTISGSNWGMNIGSPLSTNLKVFNANCRVWGPFPWSVLEPSQGTYLWNTPGNNYDATIARYISEGCKIDYTFGSVPGWANGNGGPEVPPTNFAYLYTFATALVAHNTATYGPGHFYYSIWNEFNDSADWWGGTIAQMVTIAQNLYPIIHAGDSGAIVLGPSVTGWGGTVFTFLTGFLAGGGGAYADDMNVHCYPIEDLSNGSTPSIAAPENIWMEDNNFIAAFSYYGQGSKPLTCDEGGWGDDAISPLTESQKIAYASIWLITCASEGFQWCQWYVYDDPSPAGWGPLWDYVGPWLNPVGVAYRVTQSWLVGTTITSPQARIAGTNQISNPSMTGYTAGTVGQASGNTGVMPTGMVASNGDYTHGITLSVVGSCASGTGVEFLASGTATAGAGGQVQFGFAAANAIAASRGQYWTFGFHTQMLSGAVLPTDLQTILQLNENNSSGSYLDNPIYMVFTALLGPVANNLQQMSAFSANAAVAYVQPLYTIYYTVGDTLNVPMCVSQPFIDTGSDWSMTTSAGQIVWDASGGPSSYTTSYSYQSDLTGVQAPVVGGSVTLTNKPIFLSNSARKGWAP